MSGLETAAGVIAIIQVTERVLTLCSKCYTAVKNARKDVSRLQHQVIALHDTFESVQELLDNDQGKLPTVQKLRINGFMTLCHSELEDLVDKLEKNQAVDKLGKRLFKWPFASKDIDSMVLLFERYKSSLELTLNVDQSVQLVDLAENVAEISQGLESVHLANKKHSNAIEDVKYQITASATTVHKAEEDHKRLAILQWLSAVDPSTNHSEAFAKWNAGTSTWIFAEESYCRWKLTANSFLCLWGSPGCGKTTLYSVIVEQFIEAAAGFDTGLAYAYFYFDFRDREKQSVANCISSLCGQLCRWLDPWPQELAALHKASHLGLQRPTLVRLVSLLRTIILKLKDVYLLIDAIDECPNDPHRQELLRTLITIKQFNLPNIHILVSSRLESDIQQQLRSLSTEAILVSNAVDSDIALYVRQAINFEPRLNRWSDAAKYKIEKSLRAESKGMFRWVACQLAALKLCFNEEQLRVALDTLPKTLDETYNRILQDVPGEYQEQLGKALYWLACSKRPMMARELAEAIAIDVDSGEAPRGARFEDPMDIQHVLGSLVMLSHSNNSAYESGPQAKFVPVVERYYQESSGQSSSEDEMDGVQPRGVRRRGDMLFNMTGSRASPANMLHDPQDTGPRLFDTSMAQQVVTLAHASVKDYLLSERLSNSSSPFAVDTKLANAHILRTCLSYLLALHARSASAADQKGYPLQRYARRYWFLHGENSQTTTAVQIAILRFLVKDRAVKDWIRNRLPTHPFYRPEANFSHRSFGRDYWPSYYDMDMGVQVIMQTLAGLRPRIYHNKQWKRRWPLALTPAISRIAVDHVDELRIQSRECAILTYAAAASGDFHLLVALLERGSYADFMFEPDANALHVAATNGRSEAVTILLNHKVTIDACNSRLETPLFAAAQFGYSQIVESLMTSGANVNAKAFGGWTPLYAAANRGHVDVVKLLLADSSTDAHARADSEDTALSAAAWQNHKQIVELLISADSSSTQCRSQKRMIHSLAKRGNLSLLKLCLDNGVDIDTTDTENNTALQIAISYNQIEAVRLLLDRGANTLHRNNYGESAIFSAVRADSIEAVEILLRHGVDVDCKDAGGKAPLDMAADRGLESTVEYLISQGASATDLNIIPFTRQGNISLVQRLLARGANRKRVGYNYGRIALHWAADYDMLELVKLLAIDKEDVDFVDDNGKTPLFYATLQGNTDVVDFLQSKGALVLCDAAPNPELIGMRSWKPT